MRKIKYYFLYISWRFFLYKASKKDPFMISKKEIAVFSSRRYSNAAFLKKMYKCKYEENNHYGNEINLRKYSGLTSKYPKFIIEHGLYQHETIPAGELASNRIFTYSDFREKVYLDQKIDLEITKIGPYIHYAADFYSEKEFDRIKKELGRVLLVFPSHSIEGVDAAFNMKSFIEEIENIKQKRKINTVIINLYWKDLLDADISEYQVNGYKISCVGYRSDPLFSSRLKSLIKLSDFTMGNDAGTHVGYCIYYNKPHYIMSQKISFSGENVELEFANIINSKKHLGIIKETFSQDVDYITQEQHDIADFYWGFSHIKSPNELREILMNPVKKN